MKDPQPNRAASNADADAGHAGALPPATPGDADGDVALEIAMLVDDPEQTWDFDRWDEGTAIRIDSPRVPGGTQEAKIAAPIAACQREDETNPDWVAAFRLTDGRFLLCESFGDQVVLARPFAALPDLARFLWQLRDGAPAMLGVLDQLGMLTLCDDAATAATDSGARAEGASVMPGD